MCMTSHALFELLAATIVPATMKHPAQKLYSLYYSSVVSLYMYTPFREPHPFPCRPASHFMTGSTGTVLAQTLPTTVIMLHLIQLTLDLTPRQARLFGSLNYS